MSSEPGERSGRWIVTYSDMITLLMAFFIALITFSSRESTGNKTENRTFLIDGAGGSGVAGAALKERIQKDSVLWRLRFQQSANQAGSQFAPLYRDPSQEMSAGILQGLLDTPLGKLSDGYVLRLPLGLLSGSNGKITPSGGNILLALAVNLRNLPFDFHFEAPSKESATQAVALCMFLSISGGIHPGRLSVGLRSANEEDLDSILLVLTPHK